MQGAKGEAMLHHRLVGKYSSDYEAWAEEKQQLLQQLGEATERTKAVHWTVSTSMTRPWVARHASAWYEVNVMELH